MIVFRSPDAGARRSEGTPSLRLALVVFALGLAASGGLSATACASEGEAGKPPAEAAPPAAATPALSGEPAARPVEPKPATRKAPATDEIHGTLKLGASLTERGDFDSAEIAFHQVLNSPDAALPEIKTALLGLGHLHRKQGAHTKAAAIYERYLKDYPGDDRSPDALLELGRTLRSLGVYKKAIVRFYSVLNSTLKLPGEGFARYQVLAKTAQFEIARTHFEAGEFAEANKFYNRLRLLDLAPADRNLAQFMAANSLRLQGNLEGAVSALRAFLEQAPADENSPEARYLLAVSLRELKRPQEAFAVTLDLLRAEQAHVAADAKRWNYWQRRTGNQLANSFFESGEVLPAQSIYTSLLELSAEPGWRLPLSYQIALCQERLGAFDRARVSYQGIVEAAGKTPPPDLAELVRMAAWRLEHLDWRDKVDRQINAFFETTTGKSATTAAPAKNLPKS